MSCCFKFQNHYMYINKWLVPLHFNQFILHHAVFSYYRWIKYVGFLFICDDLCNTCNVIYIIKIKRNSTIILVSIFFYCTAIDFYKTKCTGTNKMTWWPSCTKTSNVIHVNILHVVSIKVKLFKYNNMRYNYIFFGKS